MGKISDEKLNAPFVAFNTLELEYVIKAREVAKKHVAEENIDQDDLIFIRQQAMDDRSHLKGDFVISLFCQLERAIKPKYTDGKRMNITDELLWKILENAQTKEKSVKSFCAENRLTRQRYHRIVKRKFKNAYDVDRVDKMAAEITKIPGPNEKSEQFDS